MHNYYTCIHRVLVFKNCLTEAININSFLLKEKSEKSQELAEKFTFVNYNHKLENLIF